MKKPLFLILLISLSASYAQKPELVQPVGHADIVISIDVSPDGKYILTGAQDSRPLLWDMKGRVVKTYEGPESKVQSVSFSPTGQKVLASTSLGKTFVWELDGRLITVLPNIYDHPIRCYSRFLANGKGVAVGAGTKIRLYDLNGKNLTEFETIRGGITDISVSPGGNQLAVIGTSGEVGAYKINGEQLFRILAHNSTGHYASSVDFSPDGQSILSSGWGDPYFRIWNLGGQEIKSVNAHTRGSNSALFSRSGKEIISCGEDGVAKIWTVGGELVGSYEISRGITLDDVILSYDDQSVISPTSRVQRAYGATIRDRQGKVYLELTGKSSSVNASQLSPDNKQLLVGSKNSIVLWNLENREVAFHAKSYIHDACFTKDGNHILVGSDTPFLMRNDGEVLQTYTGHSMWTESVAISPDGEYVLTGSVDQTARLWRKDGAFIREFTGQSGSVIVDFSPDGKRILLGSGLFRGAGGNLLQAQSPQILGLDGTVLVELRGGSEFLQDICWSPDGQYILTGGMDKTVRLWMANGRLINEFKDFPPNTYFIQSVAFSPDSKEILIGTDKGYLGLYDLSGNKLREFDGHHDLIHDLAFSSDGNRMLSGSFDNTTKIWDTQTGKEIATLALSMSGDGKAWDNLSNWIVSEPNGLFDASQESMELMHYVQDLDVIDIGQMKERYFEPGLLSKLFGYNEEPLRDVGFLNQKLDLYPEVSLSLNGNTLSVTLIPREGGMGRTALYIGQKEVVSEVNPTKKTSFQIDLEDYQGYFPLGTPMAVGIQAWDGEEFLSSSIESVSFTLTTRNKGDNGNPTGPSFTDKPSLYVLSVGAGDYVGGNSLDLSYAEQDAREMAQILSLSGKKLFPDNAVEVHTLHTGDPSSLPSKANILAKLTEISQKVQPQDVVVLYFSGHGKTFDDQWYYLTYEMSSDILTDKVVRETKAISSSELKARMAGLKAQKQVLILDACNSGQLNQDFDLIAEKNIPSSQVRALDRLGQRAGLYIISASTADQVSYEASPYGMGLLTYALLQGMAGSSLREQEFVDVNLLFAHAEETVPKLATYVNKTQKPMTYSPVGSASFDIGRVTYDIKTSIDLKDPKPLFIASTFIDEDIFNDHLEIGLKVNNLLREYNYKGKNARLIYVEGGNIPSAYKIAGKYKREGDNLVLNAAVFKGKSSTPEGERISIYGSENDLESLADRLIKEAYSRIQ